MINILKVGSGDLGAGIQLRPDGISIMAQLDTGTKVSWTNFKYITHNYKTYASNF